MATIVLSTLNARFIHSAFGLRYLYANLGDLQSETELLEFTIQERPHEIIERILAEEPRIVGFGVYIWNIDQIVRVVRLLKRVAPDVTIVVGGPEVSYETERSPIFNDADYVITGEADIEFPKFCRALLAGEPLEKKIIHSGVPALDAIRMPYEFYSDEDLAHRVLYVEASRGCPFTCEFCLSSLDIPVRQFDLDLFLAEMKTLYERGARQFKFVDRTFNLNLRTSKAILEFFLERYEPSLFVHFEMVPDRLPEGLREIIARFPAGALQFEIGIQTFNVDVATRISRRQDYAKAAENIRYLRGNTGVHLHVDLIVGLPGEDLQSFGKGFDTLVELDPQEIQVGILKRLRGTPIVRHDVQWEMVYSPDAPYELLRSKVLDFDAMQRLARFSRYWDMIANSGNFAESVKLLWENGGSPFDGFMKWSDWLYRSTKERHGFSVKRLSEFLFSYLIEVIGIEADRAGGLLARDYHRLGARDLPQCLKPYAQQDAALQLHDAQKVLPERQQKHLKAANS